MSQTSLGLKSEDEKNVFFNLKLSWQNPAVKHQLVMTSAVPVLYLGISAKDFGVKTDPVIRDEHFALI